MNTEHSQSQFNPDDLAKITHKGLHTLSRGSEPRVTSQQLNTLKSQQQAVEQPGVVARRHFEQFLHEVGAAVKGFFAEEQKVVVQCENYGHVMRQAWGGAFPICSDCGIEITSQTRLRSATLCDKDGEAAGGRWKRLM
jgi:hypothetical protein